MDKVLVSIILPTYNRAGYIKKSIESVLRQTYRDFELIIIDDGSADGTAKILSQYQKRDSRVRIIRNEKNLGFVKSLNKGISLARGKYIARLDDDDFWSNSQKLEKQIRFFEDNPDYILVGGGMIKIDEKGKEIKKYLFPENDKDIREIMLLTDPFVHPAVVFKKEAWRLVGGYDERFYFSQDWDLWARLGKVGKMYNFPEYFVCFLQGDQNRGNKRMAYHLWLNLKIRKKYRREYPNFVKGYLFGWGAYLLKPIFLRFKQFYARNKNKKN